MNAKELKRIIRSHGWYFLREGKKHEIWTNGEASEAIPRHVEISERLARKILKNAKNNPGKDE